MERTQSASVSGPVDRPALLRGRNIVLRPLRADDVERVAGIQAEPGVARWWGSPNKAELRRQADGSDDEKAFAVEREGELVGLIQYHEENEPNFRHAGIDVFLAGQAQGLGLGTDAVRTLARYLIGERGHHRLTIDPAADNAAAIRTYEKVGFRAVGVMREYWRSPDGTWRDGLLMDLLARVRSNVSAREWSPLEPRGRNRARNPLQSHLPPKLRKQSKPVVMGCHPPPLRALAPLRSLPRKVGNRSLAVVCWRGM